MWASERAGERVEVEVADNGSGSPSAERERVFDAFFRSGAESSRSDGRCGLGLAISHAIIEAHGGTIADAALGTRVRFSLPRVRAATHSQRSRDRAAGSLDRPTGGG